MMILEGLASGAYAGAWVVGVSVTIFVGFTILAAIIKAGRALTGYDPHRQD